MLPRPGANSPVQTLQQKIAGACPWGCKPEWVLTIFNRTNPASDTYSRCQHCLGYWVTGSNGAIKSRTRAPQLSCCDRCGAFLDVPLMRSADHVCPTVQPTPGV